MDRGGFARRYSLEVGGGQWRVGHKGAFARDWRDIMVQLSKGILVGCLDQGTDS